MHLILLYSHHCYFCRFTPSSHSSARQSFERWCTFVAKLENHLPLDFILGFYVTQVSYFCFCLYPCSSSASSR